MGPAEDISLRRELDDLAEIHDRYAMGHVLDDGEIMADEQEGEAEIELQILQQVHDLRLDGYIERRNRLVAHDQVRLGSKRPRDPDTLALSAGELMRPSIRWRRVAAHLVHQRADARRHARLMTSPDRKFRMGSAMMSRTRMRGLRLANGS